MNKIMSQEWVRIHGIFVKGAASRVLPWLQNHIQCYTVYESANIGINYYNVLYSTKWTQVSLS